ncbi:hypothetical protein PR048_019733 [Dryococelus australis]|uniref:Uncharacterized protein n=1 Tax=Dryococelus australis TaxID=614101 RepID=A0ABQ9H4C6_9NEOP|nr:hypothetical protein PR048_019733 [Dryococelus australis]
MKNLQQEIQKLRDSWADILHENWKIDLKQQNYFCELFSSVQKYNSLNEKELKIDVGLLKLLNSIFEKNLEPVFMNVCIAL